MNKKSRNNGTPSDRFFDDCPICRAVREAEKKGRDLTEAELKEAFQKAKDEGAVVGGEWFEKSQEK